MGGLKGLHQLWIGSGATGSEVTEGRESPEDQQFDPGWLNLPSLAELEVLSLRIPFLDTSGLLRPSFHLSCLDLCGGGPPAVLAAVLATLLTSSSSTLSHLRLRSNGDYTSSKFLPPLSLLSSLEVLDTLHLRILPGLGLILSTLPSFPELITLLDNLDDLSALDDFLVPFEPPLQSLRVQVYGKPRKTGFS